MENRCRLIPYAVRISWKFATVALTTILISSAVITVIYPSPGMALNGEFASAFASSLSSSDNGGDDEEEVQEGEIVDQIPSLVDTGSGEPSTDDSAEEPPAEDEEQAGEQQDTTTTPPATDTGDTSTSGTAGAGRPAYDLERDCDTYEELGIPPPPPGFGAPPDATWYHCPPGVGVWVAPNGTSSLDPGGEEGSGVQQGLAQGGGVQAPPPPPTTTTTTPQAGQIQQQLQQLCAAAQQQGTSPATISPTTTTNPEGTGITSYLGGYIPSSTTTIPVQAPPTTTTTPQVAQLQQLCTALQQQIEQLPTSPDSSGGTRSTTLPDGTVIVDNPNGSYVVTTPTGATITLSKPPEQPKDPNDLVTIDHPNGVSITWKRDGGEVAKYPGDIERTTNPFGKSVIKYPGGITIQCADGSIANVPEDGKWTIIEPPPAADIGERLNRFFFGSDCAGEVLQFLPLDERLKTLIPSALGG